VLLGGGHVLGADAEHGGDQQALHAGGAVEQGLEAFVEDALVGGVHVHQDQPASFWARM
jgi:hypothetical protein